MDHVIIITAVYCNKKYYNICNFIAKWKDHNHAKLNTLMPGEITIWLER